ncbi:MAG: glycosyltransferase, partial [Gemmatimonadetes bacterium]|nr:glycosyltransferase [Gemmatimonadota bacterium]
MNQLALALILAPVVLAAYAYAGYPALLRLAATLRPKREPARAAAEWPSISISLPVYNEAAQIRGVIERLLELDYPAERRQILVISDASTDGTDDVVREYEGRGVELLRLSARNGKTAAENAARPYLRGDIVVNTDASIRIHPGALKPLLAAFDDPRVGVASGRDVSVARTDADSNSAESGYVGYEMGVRALETSIDSIVGASGCFYAIRAHLHRTYLPDSLSRDFAAALVAREHGFRAVSVDEAVCFVPRTGSLQREYRRY